MYTGPRPGVLVDGTEVGGPGWDGTVQGFGERPCARGQLLAMAMTDLYVSPIDVGFLL